MSLFYKQVYIQPKDWKSKVNVFGVETDKRSLVNLNIAATFALNVFSYIPAVFTLNMVYHAGLIAVSLMSSGNETDDKNYTSNYNPIRAVSAAVDMMCIMFQELNFAYCLFQAILSVYMYYNADGIINDLSEQFDDAGVTTFNFSYAK